MARRFSWCTLALAVLLLVTAEGLRERGTQVDDQKSASRGVLRYNAKPLEEATTAASLFKPRKSSNLERYEEATTPEAPATRRSGKRAKSKENVATEGPRVGSRRTAATERLDNKGPSVFATTESSRSRTGRKIQTTYPAKDLKTQIPTSRRYQDKKLENVETTTAAFRRARPTTERAERSTRPSRSKLNNSIARKGQETALFESESVRVDIPLAVEGTENPSEATSFVSQRRSDTKETLRRTGVERSKGRGRSNDSRRGSSKFTDFSTTEASEQSVGSRKNARDRSKNAGEPRSRARSRAESARVLERDVKRKANGERRSRPVESRGQDQDSRKSRSRSRMDVTTLLTTEVTTTVAPETTVFSDAATESELTSVGSPAPSTTTPSPSTTEGRGRGRGRGNQGRKQKEDFFNHGLGFRGRKPSLEGPSSSGDSRKATGPKNDTQYHGNPGWTLRRRPPNANYTDAPQKTIPSPRDQTNEVIPQNELPTSTEIVTSVDSSTSTTRRGFKKPLSTEESTTEVDATTKSFRRGNKTFGPGKNEHEESDNYPPDFKARLTQLKSTNTKIPALKTTPRSPLEVKRSSAALFAERSRMKLELARRLVKPELNIEENDLDATTASSFSAPKPTISSLDKLVKPSQTRRASTEKRSREDEKPRESSRLRPTTPKKGRIISERMVTSISVEERSAIEDTTKPYSSTASTSVSAEQAAATTIDSTRIRPSDLRKKPKERRLENTDSITTFKPKKPYVYQPRGTKTHSTTPEHPSVSKTLEEDVTKPTFRPRYSKRTKEKEERITTKVPAATSRYSRKKAVVKAVEGKPTTDGTATQKKLEFRPRTATYRRHSEVPTTLLESSTGVAITPRPTKAQNTSQTPQNPPSVAQEPQVNLRIANETTETVSGITGSSNGDSGNTNIFNPTRSNALTGNNTLLEQLRSTVAPLLNSLGNKTPVFSGSYSNVNNANSAPRITPNGSPPRFSARYKGAELFVRKQNNVYQPTVPSITSSSTTPATTVENSASAPPVDVSSPGEPRFLTLYHALEAADIRNEQADAREQADRVLQVDSNATVANNDTTSPVATPDTIANTTLTPRLPEDTENTTLTTGPPETTEQASTEASSTEQPSTIADSTVPPQSSTEATTTSTTDAPTTEGSAPTAQNLVESTTVTTESPESNTIPQSDANSTDVPTTEAISSNMVDAEATTVPPTTTFRPRLIDFAQDILSRLQASMNATTQSSVDSTTMLDSNSTLERTEATTPGAVGSVPTTSPTVSTPEADTSTPVTQPDSNNSTEVTTSSNDTLLTELMSIAKTLLSEEINDTDTTIAVPDAGNSSSTQESTTETPQPTTPLDPSQNEVDATDPSAGSSTDAPSTTPNALDTQPDVETNETPLAENLESTTPSLAPSTVTELATDTTIPETTPSTVNTITSTLATEITELTTTTSPEMDDTVTTNQPLTSSTNTPNETTNVPQTTPALENETPTVVARFQDTATAQGTAGSAIGQTTEITTPMTTLPSTTVSLESSTTATPTQTTTQVGRVPEQTTANIEENLVSTEPGTTMGSTQASTSVTEATTPSPTTNMGRFGASRLTPAPRFSLSSTTRAPLRDYLVYGIYPNKTIVRKRPEDNLIDARNVDSPYVIFGIFPDGRLVRKFPNGTIIPDPPRSPVEVVFSLSTTTTTNRPPPRPFYNQGVATQGPVFSNIRRPEPTRVQSPSGGSPASLPSTNETSNGTGTGSVTPQVSAGRPATASQGGRIVEDRERDEATRTKEVEGQRSSVYIGQDKFVNYWTDRASTASPQVLGVNINSVATATNAGPSSSVPSFENLLNNQQGGRVTAPPGFPWRDPLDQIFGITTSSPIITASVASNTLDEPETSNPAPMRPVNPFVEVFTPLSNAIGTPTGNAAASVTGAVPSTTTMSTSTTTMAPTTTAAPQVTTNPAATTLNSPANSQQNAFGTTFNDLVFLNSLLQSNSRTSNTKSLTQVEQLLANKILSLALNGPDPGPTRAPKAISFENASPNSVFHSTKPYDPIVIDLSPSSTAKTATWSSSTPTQVTWQPITSTASPTSLISTTKAPVTVPAKAATTPRPRTTTEAPLGLAGLLWQSLLGGQGLFGPSTTQRPVKSKQVKATTKSVNITPKPPPTTQKPETTTSTTTKTYASTPNSIARGEKSVATSTYSPEEDTKFLLSLLRAVQLEEKSTGKKAPDDEAFLRAILSGRPLTTTPPPQTETSNAALLAALLKAQGIEPETPATGIREQLQLASLGQSVTSAAPATSQSTTTTRPTSAATRPTTTTKNTPTPRPRIRTTTWSPSSTYPPPLFSSFSNYGAPAQPADQSENRALFGATRAFSQFLGAALSGAAQQLQSLVRNGTRIVSEVVG